MCGFNGILMPICYLSSSFILNKKFSMNFFIRIILEIYKNKHPYYINIKHPVGIIQKKKKTSLIILLF